MSEKRATRMSRIAALVSAVALAITGLAGLLTPTAQAADSAPFTKVFDQNANGAVMSFGNTLMTCSTGGDVCTQAKAGMAYGSANDNNYFAMTFVDMDTDPTTFNSSSSALNLPPGAQVLFARLYWGARLIAGSSGNTSHAVGSQTNRMLLKVPGAGTYQTITGTEIARNTSSSSAYQSYADVTSLVQAAGNGDYWGANVQAATGADRYAGWAITVVYTAPGLPLRNLTVYQGFNTVGAGNPQTINISGFKAPTAGAVDVQLTMLAYEGDLSQTGDFTRLNNTQLATQVSPGTNFMNSAFELNGAVNTTRNPAQRNLFGFDIKNIGASGAIPNSATSATFTFSSNGDVYYPGMVGLAINLFSPDFTASTKSVVNTARVGDSMPGDILQYTLFYTNTGQDWADNVIASDDLPANVAYVPGSLALVSTSGTGWTGSGAPKAFTDAADSDAGEFVSGAGVNGNGQVVVRFGRGCPTTGDCPGGGTLQIGDSAYIQFQVQVLDSASGTTVSNLADLNYKTHDTKINAKYTTPPVSVIVGDMADVAIEKQMVPDGGETQAVAGAPGTTTLTVTNAGPSPAKGVVITDPLPADYIPSSVSYTIDGGVDQSCGALPAVGGTVTCSLTGDLPVGSTVIVTIKGQPSSSSTATSLSNIAKVTTTSYDPDMSNNVDTVSLLMVREADVAITKTVTPATGPAGSVFTYTLTATNNGASDANNVDIYDTVTNPAQLVLLSATGGPGVTCPSPLISSQVFHCSVDAVMKPGDTVTVTATAYVPSNVAQGTVVENTGGVSSTTFDPVQSNNLAPASVTVDAPSTDLGIVKTGPLSVVAGNRASFTMTVTNKGPSDAASVVMTDWLPAGLVEDASTIATSDRGSCTVTTGTGTGTSSGAGVICDVGALPGPRTPGSTDYSSATITITGVLVPPDFSAPIFQNTASVPTPNDPNPGDNTSTTPPTSVTASHDLAVTKTGTFSRMFNEGEELTYTITVTNNGPSKSAVGTMEDTVPSPLSVESAPGCTITGNDVSCPLPALMPSDSSVFTITVKAPDPWPAGQPTWLINTAIVNCPEDVNPNNNASSWTNAGSQADLAITKASSGIVAGATGLYTLVVTNNGPSDALKPVVTDTIPSQLAIDDSALSSDCLAFGQAVTCTYPVALMGVGETWTLTIPVTATDSSLAARTLITNTTHVISPTPDPTTTNNTASVTDAVENQVDVSATIDVAEVGAYNGPGSTRDVTIVVTNNGPSRATGVQFTAGPTIQALIGPSGLPTSPDMTCVLMSQWVSCSLTNPLDPGKSVTLKIEALVAPSEPDGNYPACNPRSDYCPKPGAWVTATVNETDINPVNNHDTAPINVRTPQTDLHIEKGIQGSLTNTDGHPAFVAGGTFAYTIDVWVGPDAADAQNVTVDDALPTGFTVVQVNTAAGTCTFSPATQIHCDLGRVPGLGTDIQKIPITVYGLVDPAHAAAELVPNTAVAESTTPNLTGGNTHVESTVNADIVRHADLEQHKLVDAPVTYAGNSVGYTLTTINNGPSAVQHALITDTLPLGLTLDAVNSPACLLDVAATTALGTGQQVINCAAGVPFDPSDLTLGGIIAANTSANVRIVATTNSRDLRPWWCAGQEGVEGVFCPEILPASDLSTEYPRSITNTATVTSQAIDDNPSNNTATVDSVIDWLADIAVTSSASTTTPSAGTDVVTTLTGINFGPSSADNPKVDVTFPPGWTILKADGTPCADGLVTDECTAITIPHQICTLSHAGNPAQYSLNCEGMKDTTHRDTFTPGVTLAGNVTVHIPADANAGKYVITNETYSRSTVQCALPPGSAPRPAAAGTCESDYSNNSAPIELNVVVVADTTIVKELVTPNPLIAGRSATYKLTVTNNGPSVAHDIVISDAVPDHLTYVDGVIDGGGTCPEPVVDPGGGKTLNCDAGSLDPGESTSALITFTVDDAATLAADGTYTGQLCNSGMVGSIALDPDISNNSDEACSLVIDPPVLTLVKSVDGGPALPADWALTATGPTTITGPSGDAAVTTVAVTPGDYTLSEGSGPGWYDFVDWVCEDADNAAWSMTGANTLTMAFNDVVTCTATNTYAPPTPWLTLVKSVNGGPANATDWALSAAGPTPMTGVSGDVAVTRVPVTPGDYTLSEGTGPQWYDPAGWVCVNSESSVWSMNGADSLTLASGDKVTCTVTNTYNPPTPLLTLVKSVVGGSATPGDWQLYATGPTPIGGWTGDVAVTTVPVDPGTYTLSEGSGPGWYVLDGWACVNSEDPTWTMASADTLALAVGDKVTCTATNRFDPTYPVLTLVKSVNGGPAVATDWSLTATGPTPITGVSGASGVTSVAVNPGTYALSEGTGPAWYVADGWVCVNTADSTWTMAGADTLALRYGDVVTCTATNRYDPQTPVLTLVKSVYGGSATPDQWTLTATGPATVTGASGSPAVTSVDVAPGTYTLSEGAGPTWYDLDGWACVNAKDPTWGMLTKDTFVLSFGDNVTCTATNSYDPPTPWLTLIKNAVGGPAVPTDWTLSAVGPDTLTGVSGASEVTRVSVTPGDYVLSESGGPTWYGLYGWACTNSEDPTWTMTDATTVSVAFGDKVTCTATNLYNPPLPLLTLVKSVDGGAATSTAWQLTATGPSMIAGSSGAPSVTNVGVLPGDYTLAEMLGPQWYALVGWDCEDPNNAAWTMSGHETLTLAYGDEVTCTATNRYDPPSPQLTLVKVVDSGSAGVTDWTLTASGPTTVMGVSGDSAVTSVAVGPGVYTLSEGSGPQWYDLVGWVCVDPNNAAWAMSGSDTLTLAFGDEVTCTATNTYNPPAPVLTLVKVVASGSANVTDWSLTAAGPTTIAGVSSAPSVTSVAVSPGDYTLSESSGPKWYDLVGWVCVDPNNASWAMSGSDTLTLAIGDEVTCTATNTYNPPDPVLTLIVEVDGGDAKPTDWLAHGDGPNNLTGQTGVSGSVPSGVYSLYETDGPDNYKAGTWVCENSDGSSHPITDGKVILARGDSVTCRVINTYVAPTTPPKAPDINTGGHILRNHEMTTLLALIALMTAFGGLCLVGLRKR